MWAAIKYSPPPPTTVQPVLAKRRPPTGSQARDLLQRLSDLMSSVLHVSVAQLLENFLSVVSLVCIQTHCGATSAADTENLYNKQCSQAEDIDVKCFFQRNSNQPSIGLNAQPLKA